MAVSLRARAAWFTAQRLANGLVLVLVLYVVLWALHPSLLLSPTTVDGGDMGSHVVTALYLRQHWSFGSLTVWDPGWFNGFPLYSYYFVLPDALAAAASYVINYAVAFKLATILGSLLMPVAAFVMGKLFRAPDPIPAALAGATLPFLFDSTFTIDGGNLFSTLAGEYAFSLSLALALITIGLFARGVRTHRGRWLAAVFLSLTLAAHLLPWLYAIVVILVLLVIELAGRTGFFDASRPATGRHHGRRAVWFVVSAGAISAALSAWWLLPFATDQANTTTMGYKNLPVSSFHAIFSQLGWYTSYGGVGGDRWAIVMAAAALLAAFAWRDRLGITLTVAAVASLCGFILDPQGSIWNERLRPFWFISIYLSAGWLVGAVALRVAAWWARGAAERRAASLSASGTVTLTAAESGDLLAGARSAAVVFVTFVVALLTLLSTVPGLVPSWSADLGIRPGANQVSNWATYNYEGYQKQPGWAEFRGIIGTLDSLTAQYGCGRAMWEYDQSEGRFGTPEALMTLPYWTNNCVASEEGLLFESSATTPYHFLDQAELSAAPSDPVVGLNYSGVDVTLGVKHLQMLGVKYFFCFSSSVVKAANQDPLLKPVAVTRQWPLSGVAWHFYLIRGAALVQPVTDLPNVVANVSGRAPWLAANQTWWLDPDKWPVLYAASGPANWPRVTSADYVYRRPVGPTTVTDIKDAGQSLSFHVSTVGVPVVVKISYYPRWHASGATGPYQVSPNLMVVVPTSHDVTVYYGSSPAVWWGKWITFVALLGLVVVLWRARWWRRPLRPSR